MPFTVCLFLITWSLSLHAAQQPVSAATQEQPTNWQAELIKNNSAPVKVVEFFDYQCPYCAATVPALDEALRSYPGKVQLVLKNTPLSIHPDSLLAHQAAMAAGEQGKFWEMHALLFANQKRLKYTDLLEYARQLNLDIAHFQERLQTGYYKAAVEQDGIMAEGIGVTGTPTFFINGQRLVGKQTADRLKGAIEAALNPRSARAAASSGKPLEAVKELDLSYSPTRGRENAPVTIIEFSDMQCPFCAKVSPTLHELMRQYPDQIRWIFKSFPLSFHHDSRLAHMATLAAGEQGKFWEMHDLIFSDQHAIKRDDLLQKAQSLGLDMVRFTADLDSDKLKQHLDGDQKEGARLNVNGTPTFFINGKEHSGAMSLTKFQSILAAELSPGADDSAAIRYSGVQDIVPLGDPGAPVTLTWFSDLQSTLTLKAAMQLRELLNAHPGQLKIVFKNRPLETHPGALKLHAAALAANAQGKFWQMHDLIIANPQKDDKSTLLSYAARLGLDLKRFESDLDTDRYRSTIDRDLMEAKRRVVLGTPVFFVNTVRVDGLQPLKTIEGIVAEQLALKVRAAN
jgi:protein-disulfide isomerase